VGGADPLVERFQSLANLVLAGHLPDGFQGPFDVAPRLEDGRQHHEPLVPQLVLNPPILVVGSVEIGNRLPNPGRESNRPSAWASRILRSAYDSNLSINGFGRGLGCDMRGLANALQQNSHFTERRQIVVWV
jgi:hypothetical protein